MQTYSIPILGRERYLAGESERTTVVDSRGTSRTLWPTTVDIPSSLLIHLEGGTLQWIEFDYLIDQGEPFSHHVEGLGEFRLYVYSGLFSVLFPEPQPLYGQAYEEVREKIGRLLEMTRFQSDLAPGKWKTILTVRLLAEQWREGEDFLRRLIAQGPHPYR